MSWVILLLVVAGIVVIALTPVARAASRSRSARGEPQETSRRPLPQTGETGGEPPPGSQRYRDEQRGRQPGDT